jgi:hypothetical protein
MEVNVAAIDDDPEIVGLWQEIGIPVTMVLDWGHCVGPTY